MKGRIIILLTIIICTASECGRNVVIVDSQEKKNFLESTEMGYYVDGKPFFIYDENIHQLCHNSKRNQIRIQTDNQNNFFNLALQSKPKTEGVRVVAQFDYSFFEDDGSYIILFECSKITEDYLWLWDAEEKRGLIIKKGV